MEKQSNIKFKIVNLSAKDKQMDWTLKIKAISGITEAKKTYKINIRVDEEYFSRKIEAIEIKIEDRRKNPDMFGDSKSSIKNLEQDIKNIETDQKDCEELEILDFDATTVSASFKDGVLIINIPEDKIEEIIKIRHRVEAFVVNLK